MELVVAMESRLLEGFQRRRSETPGLLWKTRDARLLKVALNGFEMLMLLIRIDEKLKGTNRSLKPLGGFVEEKVQL